MKKYSVIAKELQTKSVWSKKFNRSFQRKNIVTTYKGTFTDKKRALKKAKELCKLSREVSVFELDLDKPFFYRTGRQQSSGYYTSASNLKKEYDKKIIFEYIK